MSKHKSDEDLLNACTNGKQTAWFELVDRYSRLVFSVPKRYGLDQADSEDVMQAVFLRLFKNFQKISKPQALPAWLLTTAHRETWRLSQARNKTTILSDAEASVSDPPEESLMVWEQQHQVREALAILGGECKILLEMLFLHDKSLTYGEIAKEMDIPVGAIGPTRARCFSKLVPILESLGVSVAHR